MLIVPVSMYATPQQFQRSPPCRCPAPRRMKSDQTIEERVCGGDERSSYPWCREPVKEFDPGDLAHHPLWPPSGEHAEENSSIRIAANRRWEDSRGELEGAVRAVCRMQCAQENRDRPR
jgi:hypothetical protein